MRRVIRAFTLESDLSTTLDELAEAGLTSHLLLHLLKNESPPIVIVKPLNFSDFDEAGLRPGDYERFYSMIKLPASWVSREPTMPRLLTALNLHGHGQAQEVNAAINVAISENSKIRRHEERQYQKAVKTAERTNRKTAAAGVRNYNNASRITEALIVLGLDTLKGKAAALDTARSSKTDASQSGNKQFESGGRKNPEARTLRGGARAASLSS